MTQLGALRCATIVCPSVQAAVDLYRAGLGYQLLERSTVSAELAACWGTAELVGAACAVLGPASGAPTYLRFVEDDLVTAPPPYSTLGWAALEFSVQSSDAAVERLAGAGFTVLGPAQDLAFSQGALRAGQVAGPFGEVLYLTQVNAPGPGYALPVASAPVDRLFIAIEGVPDIASAYSCHGAQFGMQPKDRFDAHVPFIADFHGLPPSHAYAIGCLETLPGSYVEVDQMPATICRRAHRDGRLPPGIAMVGFEVADPADACKDATAPHGRGNVVHPRGRAARVDGAFGAWIELIHTV